MFFAVMDPAALVKLAEIFHPRFLARGLADVRAGTPIVLTPVDADFHEARVGAEPEPRIVRFRFRERGARFLISSTCTCEIGANCEHVAAAIVALLEARVETTRQLGFDMTPPPMIRPAVDRWLSRVTLLGRVSPEPVHDKAIGYIFYSAATEQCPTISVVTLPRKADGGFGKPTTNNPYTISTSAHEYVTPIDRAIAHTMRSLSQLREVAPRARQAIYDDLITRIVATGRAYFETTTRPPLFRAEPVAAPLAWRYFDDDSQRLIVDVDARYGVIYGLRSYAVELASGACGALELGLDADETAIVLDAPFVNALEARKIAETVAPRLSLSRIPAPSGVAIVRERGAPGVRLEVGDAPTGGLYLRPYFLYADVAVTVDDLDDAVRVPDTAQLRLIERDAATERAVREELTRMHGLPRREDGVTVYALPPLERATLLRARLPRLRERGWEIVDTTRAAHPLLVAETPWRASVAEREGAWYAVGVDLRVGEETIAALPLLLGVLRRLPPDAEETDIAGLCEGGYLYLTLPDGRDLALPEARARRVLRLLRALHGTAPLLDGQAHATLADVRELLAEDAGIVADDARYAFDRTRAEEDEAAFDARLAREFATALRPYQRTGVAWLRRIATACAGGVLADDMGLGKTVQTLAHIVLEKAAGALDEPALIVVPTSLVPNWLAEARRFAPDLRVLGHTGPERAATLADARAYDVVVTTYALLARDADVLAERTWHAAILDEAQFIKNARGKTAEAARRLRARSRICLTGTPIENNLAELWSLYAFALPRLLGDYRHFARRFRVPIEKHGDADRAAELRRALSPYLLRRTKDRVAEELPPRVEIAQTVELGEAQRELYEIVRASVDARVRREIDERGVGRAKIVILDALLQLRQVCCDPRLVKKRPPDVAYPSAKLDMLIDHVESLLGAERRVLIFSQFTSMLELIGEALRDRLIDYVRLTGETTDRETPVARFQNREVAVFLISLKAGGFGLNLTAADTVIHYDPWWNPAAERQASDRAHRIGQTRSVFVYKYAAAGSVEERIQEIQRRKGAIADALFDPDAPGPAAFDEDDVRALFAPLDAPRG